MTSRYHTPWWLWLVALLGAIALGSLALMRNESIGALWVLVAAICCYTVGYRLYARYLSTTVFELDDRRLTPAFKLENGRDFLPMNRYVLFGHHFAAIAGAGPLVGPILAAQYGYLPGTLWIIIGVVLGGAVQDFIVLAGSMRRNGKSLGQMVKDEMGPVAGLVAMLAILVIMIMLLAVLGLVVVKALAQSPWGTFTIAATIPIALLVGLYMRVWRPGKVTEASTIGVVLLLAALLGGQWVAQTPLLATWFTWRAQDLAWALMIYGFSAAVLPVWLLLGPRDYLSTFVKIGTVLLMAAGVLVGMPELKMPAVTSFVNGTGPVVAGGVFPFCFITIACGAISGFHALVASGTTPKLLARESDARLVGYGAMLMESFVAIMALIAACALEPGIYLAINAPAALTGQTPEAVAQAITQWGFSLKPEQMSTLAALVGESSLYNRNGGAPTFALGMAQILSNLIGGPALLGLWYHFAIMFEALFILTTLDAGTRVGRFLLQDLLGQIWEPLGQTSWYPGAVLATFLIVAGWGYFLYQGVIDPLGGVNTLWPLFGIANQLLALIALCLGTSMLIQSGKARHSWITLIPLLWLGSVTFSASTAKLFSTNPRIGFWAHYQMLADKLNQGNPPPDAAMLMRNDLVNLSVTGFLVLLTGTIIVIAITQWVRLLKGSMPRQNTESAVEYHSGISPCA